ncbi:MAG: hypothetical protein GKC07_08400 [Methanomicrobiales archaeon]|nr:hypothetical protein [Methanomicrobiales archaeon]
MKRIALLAIALLLLTGGVIADHTIPPVPETQGIVTSTSVNAVGNFASATELQWRISAGNALPDIPPLIEAGIYETTYTEDTQTHGVGLMLYDKELDVETSGQLSGQWNVEATKQIAFIGIDGAYVVSTDNIMVDGAGWPDKASEALICPFAGVEWAVIPAFCNRAEAGSTIDMTVANVRTTSTDRFVTPSGDHPVELNHDIRVAELVSDVPSVGMASAYMDVLIQEGRGIFRDFNGNSDLFILQNNHVIDPLMERIEFSEETTADGAITLFEKLMHYESMVTGFTPGIITVDL